MTRLRFSRTARADLAAIAEFVDNHAGAASAGRVIASIRRTCQTLASSPGIGRFRPEIAPAVQSFVVTDYGYVVLYRQVDRAVEIVAVIHGARDLPEATRGRFP
jgi:toxin ParE1/3/4